MKRTSFARMECSIAQSLEVVGEWWTLLVVRDAFLGVRRFEDFQRRLGVSRNVLTERLAKLVDNGILEPVRYLEHPPRSEYRLTDKGRDLYPVIVSLRQWGDRWMQDGPPPVVVRHLDCGMETEAVLTCSHCGGPITARNVRASGSVVPSESERPVPVA
ncbi:MAG TPA: helix-turn-helix domain-containing protein [Candidatus Dormibacteraeota bacterium]|nr:helix-turn-helix domain-containing protein [Candidatus Dormibacteraeota bacterium]